MDGQAGGGAFWFVMTASSLHNMSYIDKVRTRLLIRICLISHQAGSSDRPYIQPCRNVAAPWRVKVSAAHRIYLRARLLPKRPKVVEPWRSQSPCTPQSFPDSIPSMPLFTTSTSSIYLKCTNYHGTLPFATPKQSRVLPSLSPSEG